MGMSVGGNNRGVQSEINITPLIDVVLVLLIIYMAALPMYLKGMPLEVPRKLDDATEILASDVKQLVITVKADMTVVFNDGDKEVSMAAIDVVKTLKPLLEAKRTEKVVFVDYEDGVPWGQAIAIMDSIRSLATDNGPDDNHNEIKVALKLPEVPVVTQ